MTSTGPAADAARAEVRELIAAKGHAVDNARAAVDRLEAAFADGSLQRTPSMDQFLADLMQALEQDEGEKLGGKSAEAARFILRAVDRELDAGLSGVESRAGRALRAAGIPAGRYPVAGLRLPRGGLVWRSDACVVRRV